MKVLFITATFPPVPCGVGDYTFHLASELGRRGHPVTVLTSCAACPSSAPLTLQPLIQRWDVRGALRMGRFIARSDADVISFQYVPHAFGHRGINLSTPLALLAARVLSRKSIVVTGHELYLEWGPHPAHWPLSIIHYLQLLILLLAANHVIVVTEGQKNRLRPFLKWIPRPVEWIPVGANVLPAAESSPRKQARERLGIKNKFVIGSFWLKEPNGASAKLHRWASHLREQGMDVLLLIIGKAALPKDKPWIRQTGYLETHAELSQALSCLDLFISARGEGPTTRHTSITAALAHGLPTLAVRGPSSTPESFWANSGLIPIDDGDAVAATIQQLLLDPAQQEALARQALQFYEDHFSWTAIAVSVESVFRHALRQPETVDVASTVRGL